MRSTTLLKAPWRDPLAVLAAVARRDFTLGLMSGGGGPRGRWSYVMADPAWVLTAEASDPADPFRAMRDRLGPLAPGLADGPPFQGGIAGLLGYELGWRIEGVGHRGTPDWPDAVCGVFDRLLAFDHVGAEVVAVGRGEDDAASERAARAAIAWLEAAAGPGAPAGRLADDFQPVTPGEDYEAHVADVTARIAAGEIFQANVARSWRGRLRPGVQPIDLLARLAADSPAPFAAYFSLPGRAVVSNSPERFVQVRPEAGLTVESRPIKGTRPRGADPAEDEALRRELVGCEKDRAENLMIVDLMRNDLSRVCPPGTVAAPELFALESFANVHHLVSTVTGRLGPGLGPIDLLEAAFPPGSITGAPKIQAIKVIADYEGPRGPYCGSIFWAGFDGACDSSVLIRTVALVCEEGRWRFEARAGAGLVADSDPHLERLETEAKIDAIRRALAEAPA